MTMIQTALRTHSFTESVIREMTRLANAHQAVNLAQGFPDYDPPSEMLEAAILAIRNGLNQYAITWGTPNLRQAIAKKTKTFLGIIVDPETEITVTCGSTEAMIASLLAVVNPGDEVIVFEPFYENYGPDAILSQAQPRYVPLYPPKNEGGSWFFDFEELEQAFNNKTKAIILNTPNNPTGKVFTRQELGHIASLCQKWNVIAVTDEIYEHMVYDGLEHISLAVLPGMQERTIVINAISKTYSATGWRVGWALAPREITASIRKVHDFLTVGAPHPFQEAAAVALGLPGSYYEKLCEDYRQRRDFFLPVLQSAGFRCWKPFGAYYIMCDFSDVKRPPFIQEDRAFAEWLVSEIGVAPVPGSSFFTVSESGAPKGTTQVRFSFGRKMALLEEASRCMQKLTVL
jgi:aspartate/methionine/tyrosine aminotransferase